MSAHQASAQFFTRQEWNQIVTAARQARTFRAYEAAGRRAGNETQRLSMAVSARAWEREVRRFAKSAMAKASASAS